MSNRLKPMIGHWYSRLEKGDLFQVVAVDAPAGTIEIQDFDGGLDEMDVEEWRQMAIEPAAPPEDWSGPVDDVEPDEFGYTDMQGEETSPERLEADALTWADVLEEREVEDEDFDLLPPTRHRAPGPGHGRRHH